MNIIRLTLKEEVPIAGSVAVQEGEGGRRHSLQAPPQQCWVGAVWDAPKAALRHQVGEVAGEGVTLAVYEQHFGVVEVHGTPHVVNGRA